MIKQGWDSIVNWLRRLLPRFKSVEQYEQEMYDTLDEKAYDVEELYFDDKRIVVQIATSDWFNNFTLLVIVFNVCWIGYDTDANTEANILDAPMAFLVMEYFFTVTRWRLRFIRIPMVSQMNVMKARRIPIMSWSWKGGRHS